MENKAKIAGDKNTVIQGVKKSDVDINSNNQQTKNKGTIVGTVIAVVGVIITVIVGWDNILKFFK